MFLNLFTNKIIYHFVMFVAKRKRRTTDFFSSSFVRSGIWDLKWVKIRIWNKNPGSATLAVGVPSPFCDHHSLVMGSAPVSAAQAGITFTTEMTPFEERV